MTNFLVKVRRKMSIAAHHRVRSALEGEYASTFKSRSMDFDDLREYVPGDDVKDIDWKATARSNQVLIKRYVATRKYNILLVVDTGRSMAATAPSGESKRDIAVMAAGIIASVAQKHNDLIALAAANSEQTYSLPFRDSRMHAERILQYINDSISIDSPVSDLTALLDYVRRTVRRRSMLVVISDNLQFATMQEQLLRRLSVQHELLFIAIDDVDPSDPRWNERELYDVEQPTLLPSYLRRRKDVNQAYSQFLRKEWEKSHRMLKHTKISNVRIGREDDVVNQIVRLLEEHKHARR